MGAYSVATEHAPLFVTKSESIWAWDEKVKHKNQWLEALFGKNIKTLSLSFLLSKQHWVTGDFQIIVLEPCPHQNREQTRHAKVLFTSQLLHLPSQ